uniref:Transposase n=1 Tax=Steinernema glaseri TaxID=37863 RepID=A0A1I7ZVB9_9BILA
MTKPLCITHRKWQIFLLTERIVVIDLQSGTCGTAEHVLTSIRNRFRQSSVKFTDQKGGVPPGRTRFCKEGNPEGLLRI